jgi:hypothetical protein
MAKKDEIPLDIGQIYAINGLPKLLIACIRRASLPLAGFFCALSSQDCGSSAQKRVKTHRTFLYDLRIVHVGGF